MANRIQGISKLHYAIFDEATGRFGDVKPLRGAKDFETSKEIAESKFYSDSVMDVFQSKTSSMSLTVNLAYLPVEIASEILGMEINSVGGLVTGTDDKQPTIALFYEGATLEQPIRRVIYNCKMTLTDTTIATSEGEVTEDALVPMTGIAIPYNGALDQVMDANSIPTGKEVEFKKAFDGFFTNIVLPDGTIQTAPAKEVKAK